MFSPLVITSYFCHLFPCRIFILCKARRFCLHWEKSRFREEIEICKESGKFSSKCNPKVYHYKSKWMCGMFEYWQASRLAKFPVFEDCSRSMSIEKVQLCKLVFWTWMTCPWISSCRHFFSYETCWRSLSNENLVRDRLWYLPLHDWEEASWKSHFTSFDELSNGSVLRILIKYQWFGPVFHCTIKVLSRDQI